MNKIFLLAKIFLVLFLLIGNILLAQEKVASDSFTVFLDDFYQNLQQIQQMHDSSLSRDTNLEIQIRKWNDYLAQKLPRRDLVIVPVEEVSLGKEKYNRSQAQIVYNFRIKIPKEHFQYENNVDAKGQFFIKKVQLENDSSDFQILELQINNIFVESPLAKTQDILNNQSHLVFEIKMDITRESGWLHFYQTILSLESVTWMIDDVILWQLETLPFEEIMKRRGK